MKKEEKKTILKKPKTNVKGWKSISAYKKVPKMQGDGFFAY